MSVEDSMGNLEWYKECNRFSSLMKYTELIPILTNIPHDSSSAEHIDFHHFPLLTLSFREDNSYLSAWA